MAWQQYLVQASYKGVLFDVVSATTTGGRKVAVHDYPFKDLPWAEDLGLADQRFSLRGFLVGDDCYAQEQVLHYVCAQSGPGILVHPTWGTLTNIACVSLNTSVVADSGRMVSVEFEFIKTSAGSTFPGVVTDVLTAISDASALAILAANGDYADVVAGLSAATSQYSGFLSSTLGISSQVTSAVSTFGATAAAVIGDAGVLGSAVDGLVGNYGRYSLGNGDPTSTITSVLAAGTTAVAGVTTGISEMNSLAALI